MEDTVLFYLKEKKKELATFKKVSNSESVWRTGKVTRTKKAFSFLALKSKLTWRSFKKRYGFS